MSHQSTRRKTIQKLIDAYSSLSVDQLAAVLTPDFRQTVRPRSLGMPVHDIDQFKRSAAGIFKVFETFAMIPETILEDGQQNTIILHCRMEGILKNTRETHVNECVLIARLSKDLSLVSELVEFVDSAQAMRMHSEVAPDHFIS